MKKSLDQSYQLLAARHICKQVDALIRQVGGVHKNEDVECVHKARVASRRIRAAINMFSEYLPDKKGKNWRKEIRRVTKKLGAARDTDVQILFINETLSQLTEGSCLQGIQRLLLRLKQKRDTLQEPAVKALNRLQKRRTLEQMHQWAAKTKTNLQKKNVRLQSPCVFQEAQKHILNRWDKILTFAASLDDPQDYKRHHQMRVEVKRLRYTMEICNPAYEDSLNDYIKGVKKLQTLLGDIHDCDVWVENLALFLDDERQKTLDYYGHTEHFGQLQTGIEYLIRQRQESREQLFHELVEYWRQTNKNGLWGNMHQQIRAPTAQPIKLIIHDNQLQAIPEDTGT